jgi:hypothetical protein
MKFYFIAYFFVKKPALLAILDSYGADCGLERYASSPGFVCLSDTLISRSYQNMEKRSFHSTTANNEFYSKNFSVQVFEKQSQSLAT